VFHFRGCLAFVSSLTPLAASVIDKRLDVVEGASTVHPIGPPLTLSELINAPDKLRAIRKNLKPLEGVGLLLSEND